MEQEKSKAFHFINLWNELVRQWYSSNKKAQHKRISTDNGILQNAMNTLFESMFELNA